MVHQYQAQLLKLSLPKLNLNLSHVQELLYKGYITLLTDSLCTLNCTPESWKCHQKETEQRSNVPMAQFAMSASIFRQFFWLPLVSQISKQAGKLASIFPSVTF